MFGLGHVCGTEGYCQEAAAHPRCRATHPHNVLENPGQAIVFGAIFDNSLESQQARSRSLLLALKEVNDNGGLEGRQLGVVLCDVADSEEARMRYRDALDSVEAAAETATYLAKTLGVPALIGPSGSATSVTTTFSAVRRSNTALMTSSSASLPLDPEVVNDIRPGLLWSTAPPDALQGPAIVHDMLNPSQAPGDGRRSVPAQRVAILHQEGSQGRGLATRIRALFNAQGKADTYARLINYNTTDQLAQAVKTVAGDSYSSVQELIFISSRPTDHEAFLTQVAASTTLDEKGIFFTDAAAAKSALSSSSVPDKAALFSRVRGSRPAPSAPEQDTTRKVFSASFSKEYGTSPDAFPFASHTYDAAWLVFAGAAWSLLREERVTGPGVARGLRRVSSGESIDIHGPSWRQVVERFRAGQAINLRGASSELDFDPKTEEITSPIEIWGVEQQASGWDLRTKYTWIPSS
jgi:branched-chain amino acid transport system substrate-binding protein